MENGNFVITNNINIDASVRSSVRYNLVHKMMEENFSRWISQQSSLNLIQKLIDECKKQNISLVFLFINLVNSQSYFYNKSWIFESITSNEFTIFSYAPDFAEFYCFIELSNREKEYANWIPNFAWGKKKGNYFIIFYVLA